MIRFMPMWSAILFAGFLCCTVPLRGALELGGDEGLELMKGLLCSRGYALYGQIWNDQPPFHTGLLAILFNVFGPSVLGPRLMAVGFAGLLVATFYELVRRQSGHFAALAGLLLLTAWPHFLQLSVSVMLEMPVMAVGLLSVLGLMLYYERRNLAWIGLSGLVMGLALQTKLTAAIFIPASLTLLCLRPDDYGTKASAGEALKRGAGRLLTWFAGLFLAAGAVWLFFPDESLATLLTSHFSAQTKAAVVNGYGFRPRELWDASYYAIIPALVAVPWIVWRREPRLFSAVILLLTVCLIHAFHRPYWPYYTLHFAIPICWLAGILARELFQWICRRREKPNWLVKTIGPVLAWSALFSLAVADLPERWESSLKPLVEAKRAKENAEVRRLTAFRDRTRWVFTDRVIYAFHARLCLPPELAVIPFKRFWSQQINDEGVVMLLKKYQPEQIVLFRDRWQTPQMTNFLKENYARQANEGAAMYLRNGLADEGRGMSNRDLH